MSNSLKHCLSFVIAKDTRDEFTLCMDECQKEIFEECMRLLSEEGAHYNLHPIIDEPISTVEIALEFNDTKFVEGWLVWVANDCPGELVTYGEAFLNCFIHAVYNVLAKYNFCGHIVDEACKSIEYRLVEVEVERWT